MWGYDLNPSANSNVVDVYVRYLRNRLLIESDADGDRSLIATIRGAGYQFNPPTESGPVPVPEARGLEQAPSAGQLP